MAFDPAILDQPILKADPQRHSLLQEQLQDKEDSFREDYCSQLRYLIRLAISAGDCSIEKVANTLDINKRTLQRHLRCHNTSFQELLEEVRFNLAKRYLLESNGSLTTLTYMLGYSEPSAFSNAFRRQYGVSPKQWRLQHSFL